MGRVDGTSRDNDRPAGVADAFQVRIHSVEPMLSNRSRNLLSHPDSGPSGTDEAELLRPEMALILLAFAFACNGEWLAGAASGPEFPVVWPASQSSSEGPSTDAGEEVALCVAFEVIGTDIDDRSFINVARRDVPSGDQVAEPLGSVGVELVVVGGHDLTFPTMVFFWTPATRAAVIFCFCLSA
jgi:hypothetical protein